MLVFISAVGPKLPSLIRAIKSDPFERIVGLIHCNRITAPHSLINNRRPSPHILLQSFKFAPCLCVDVLNK